MLIAVLAFSVPAAASNAHRLAHVEVPVTVGEQHHHHGVSAGQVETHDEQSDDQSDNDRKDKGISHPHASAAAGDMLAADTHQSIVLRSTPGHPRAWAVHRLTTRGWTPHQRPPRTA